MDYTFMTLKALLTDYNQFKKSKLQLEIMAVLRCSYTEAFELGKTHCNMISTWAILFAIRSYQGSYASFYRQCLTLKLCTKEGFFNVDKIDTADEPGLFTQLGLKVKIIKYDKLPDNFEPHQAFQVAVNGKHHFIAGASADDGQAFLFDTNDRFYGAEIHEALAQKNDKVDWVKIFELAA